METAPAHWRNVVRRRSLPSAVNATQARTSGDWPIDSAIVSHPRKAVTWRCSLLVGGFSRALPVAVALLFTADAGAIVQADSNPDSARHRVSSIGVPFVGNAGQWDESAAFAATTFAGTVFAMRDGRLVYSLAGARSGDAVEPPSPSPSIRPRSPQVRGPGAVLAETIVDASSGSPISLRPLGSGCTLDADGNNNIDALTDGLVMLRAMFGLTGTTVTTGAVGANATRSTWAQIRTYLNGNCGTNFAP